MTALDKQFIERKLSLLTKYEQVMKKTRGV
ncbi:MAG: hypothetical protein UY09_C0021G0004 [Parcubacteria group bacterium GW2011_GWA2_47_8]|nr:MAG: hypothetical protein UY09_C0021G0004 [Parcubacteria group bacterium GW2011_GWA2_47_8]